MPTIPVNRKHVFTDWSLTEGGYGVAWSGAPVPSLMPSGIKIVTFRPTMQPEPMIVSDRPWEKVFINAYSTFFEDEGRFRAYYEAFSEYENDSSCRLCYAESDDGVRWRKPNLGLVEFDGWKDNNIIFDRALSLGRGPHGAMVFKDPNGPDSERYKMVHCAGDERGMYVAGAVSPDGIRWTALEEPVLREDADTQTVVVWDADLEKYRGYFRKWPPGNLWHARRIVEQAETPDFYNWPEPTLAITTDANDPPGTDIYTNSYTPWPGACDAHLMFPCFYPRTPDTMETHLAVSRDGRTWQRPFHEPLLPSGPPESHWYAGLVAGQGIMRTKPGEWTIPVAPRVMTHNETHYDGGFSDTGGLWRATIREDGLMAVQADARGEFWTVPLTPTGTKITVNAWTHYGGAVRLGLEDEKGPIAGYTLADCDPLTGDTLFKAFTWKGNSRLPEMGDRWIRLHSEIVRGRMYAFRFEA